mmetsp:Transcript_5664/g.14458  ORF Transcript_5664/g.14458 Transcript_5664/m.14458 type:complete len:191 (-) Transcript_5664:287-859(-)
MIDQMKKDLDNDTLTRFPDLDGALQGFETPCCAIVTEALVEWRSASVEKHFWTRLSRFPLSSYEKLLLQLTDGQHNAFGFARTTSLLDQPWAMLWLTLAYHEEEEVWNSMSHLESYQERLQERISQMLVEQMESKLMNAQGRDQQPSVQLDRPAYGPMSFSQTLRKLSSKISDDLSFVRGSAESGTSAHN